MCVRACALKLAFYRLGAGIYPEQSVLQSDWDVVPFCRMKSSIASFREVHPREGISHGYSQKVPRISTVSSSKFSSIVWNSPITGYKSNLRSTQHILASSYLIQAGLQVLPAGWNLIHWNGVIVYWSTPRKPRIHVFMGITSSSPWINVVKTDYPWLLSFRSPQIFECWLYWRTIRFE